MSNDPPDDIDLEEQADAVADFVEELLGQMEIDAIAEPAQQGERFYVDILEGPPEDLALLIGKHGQTLDAIQELAHNVGGRRPSGRWQQVKSRNSSPWMPLNARSSTTPWRVSKAFRADPAVRIRTGSWWSAPSIDDPRPHLSSWRMFHVKHEAWGRW